MCCVRGADMFGDGLLILLVYVCGVIALLGLLEGLSLCSAGFLRPAWLRLVDRALRSYRRAGRLHLGRMRQDP